MRSFAVQNYIAAVHNCIAGHNCLSSVWKLLMCCYTVLIRVFARPSLTRVDKISQILDPIFVFVPEENLCRKPFPPFPKLRTLSPETRS